MTREKLCNMITIYFLIKYDTWTYNLGRKGAEKWADIALKKAFLEICTLGNLDNVRPKYHLYLTKCVSSTLYQL